MRSQDVEIHGSEISSAISYAEQIEKGVKDSLEQAKALQSYVTGTRWSGKTNDAFLCYLDVLIQYNAKVATVLEGQTKALKELDESIQSFANRIEVEKIKRL
ncbi:WXG100 family type VII secretion target [Bacillus sp. FJAT-51639]|uniref:WXG100 family type VII secretion target n=1 Tax=Bacillus bruguierae TaxID=3127667 RepID=A0ABU8FL72_9BACI